MFQKLFKLFIIATLVSCKAESLEKPVYTIGDYTDVNASYSVNDSSYFNADIETIGENSWVLTGHANDLCIGEFTSPCRKSMVSYVEGVSVSNRVTKYTFGFQVNEYDLELNPFWVIVYQDWVKFDPSDTNGNHPLTTLKLKKVDGELNIVHFNNAWQLDYEFPTADPTDAYHEHDLNRPSGSKVINIGQKYLISIENYDSGRVTVKIDGSVVSNAFYQTKSPTESHTQLFGMYWDKGYNNTHDINQRLSVTITDLTRYEMLL